MSAKSLAAFSASATKNAVNSVNPQMPLCVEAHPLLAAGGFQQIAVKIAAPVPIKAEGGKGIVESQAMRLFGFRQRAVNIEDQGAEHYVRAASAAARMARILSP